MSAAGTDPALQTGSRALADGDYALALEQAQLALAAAPQSGDALILRVNALLKLERWHDAVGDLESLIARNAHQPQLRRLLGLCWLRIGNACKSAGDDAAAVDAYQRSIRADPLSQDARHNLGTLLLRLERFAEALPMLAAVASAEPGNDEAVLDLARAELATGAEQPAIARLVALARHSGRGEVLEAAAGILLDAGRIDESAAAALSMADGVPGWTGSVTAGVTVAIGTIIMFLGRVVAKRKKAQANGTADDKKDNVNAAVRMHTGRELGDK